MTYELFCVNFCTVSLFNCIYFLINQLYFSFLSNSDLIVFIS